jgi:hypothetical protein
MPILYARASVHCYARPGPPIARSSGDITVFDVKGSRFFKDANDVARDPLTKIRRLHPEYR